MPNRPRSVDRDGVSAPPPAPVSADEALALAVRISREVRGSLPESPEVGPPETLTFEEAFSALAAREGGRLRDPRVPDDEICFGDLAFDAPRLSPDLARDLYRTSCWVPTFCDHLPRAVALEVFDMAVVSGAEAARRALQVALRLPETDLPATEFLLEIRQADPVRLRARFLIARLADIAGRLSGP